MVVAVWRKPGMSQEDFESRWFVDHGALVREYGPAMGFVRYIQSHKVASPAIDALAEGRGWGEPPDGLTEIWWESVDQMNIALGSLEGQAASKLLAEDEVHFIESTRITGFLSTEKVVFDFTGKTAPST
ncbi:EthD domain-containing protein [Sphingomonas sp. SRS2]|uniref:EthD domain-containing protein n=1 Tax=Sphingomonas sp. SRS2 TaxID=133190 RepID=UPI001F275882|nr:EthD domain-containing protein [Sphingomonas sp. SRS2]